MTAPRFLAPAAALAAARDVPGIPVVLEGAEARHAAVVRRLAVGERVDVSDGLGTVAEGSEVGVDVIVTWQSERAVVQWRGERGTRALERWRSTAREAGKQARRARLPVVTELASTAAVAELLREAELGVVLHEDAELPLVRTPVPPAGDVVLVVGPKAGSPTVSCQCSEPITPAGWGPPTRIKGWAVELKAPWQGCGGRSGRGRRDGRGDVVAVPAGGRGGPAHPRLVGLVVLGMVTEAMLNGPRNEARESATTM